ncbi:sulfotransferase domain protein [Halomonas elongata]|uniref:Sulfotransferase domain protein n=1 Tax=Halomonas elongata TaxID=2746 RepID=A0A1B8P310_HALEL|nr:sulfotransferase [Halomonas elongata]OBX36641.1 sulfotransferase domain protein [Halomonas elongata]
MSKFFIGMGFQKCATTWLSMRFKRSSNIWVPPINELHFWDSYFYGKQLPVQKQLANRWFENGLNSKSIDQKIKSAENVEYWRKYISIESLNADAYNTLFSEGSQHMVKGEITPSYISLSEDQVKTIDELMNNKPHYFVIMREPMARLWSQIRHEKRLRPRNVETEQDIENFIESQFVKDQYRYDLYIEKMRSVIPDDRLGFFFFEDMVEDEESFLKNVCSFLDTPYEEVMKSQDKKVGEGRKSSKCPDFVMKKSLEVHGDVVEKVEALLGRVPRRWKDHG